MPHLSGVFDEFPDLDKISVDEIAAKLATKFETHFIMNYLGNRLLYPQVIALTPQELVIDLAILQIAAKTRPSLFFEPQTNKLLIPRRFVERFPNLELLIKAIIQGVNPKGVHIIYIKDASGLEAVGSVVSPINPQKLTEGGEVVEFTGLAIAKSLPLGAISVVPTPAKTAKIKLGNQEYEVGGGEVGIVVDLRLGGFA